MSVCKIEERDAGRSYPRTCPTCKLTGPCAKGLDRKGMADRIEALEAKLAEEARVSTMRGNMIELELLPSLHDAEAKMAKAVWALRFYADEENYRGQSYVEECGCCSSWLEPKIHIDGEDSGDLARATLAELTGGKDG